MGHPSSNLRSVGLIFLLLGSCSLLLRTDATHFARKRFHFRSFWPKLPGFLQVVERAWHCPMHHADPFSKLAGLLHNTAHCLQSWSSKPIKNVLTQLSLASRSQKILEAQILGTCLTQVHHNATGVANPPAKEGDAPTHFFHIQASQHHRKIS
jgi:hypothetical protein